MAKILIENVEFPSNSHTTPGYLARPDDDRDHPAIVAIQEYWGLVPHIKEVVNRFANAGFVALAPDLYHGKQAVEPDEARKLAMELDRDKAVGEIEGAVNYLISIDYVQPKIIGVVGWCMGGSLALATAATDAGSSKAVGAVVAFYGTPRDPTLAVNIKAPLLGLYGEHDHGIPLDIVQNFDKALDEHRVKHEIHIYPSASHAFFNDTRPEAYNPKAAEDAWKRTIEWFRKYLKT